MTEELSRTVRQYNLHLVNRSDCDEWEMPTIEPCHEVPESLRMFRVGTTDQDAFAHFFLYDFRFERLWKTPERYINSLDQYAGLIAPDFSTYADMPIPMQIWNVYRSRALTHWWQRLGFDVVPVLQWSDRRSYGFCFEGLPEGGTYAIATAGVVEQRAYKTFGEGLCEAVKRVRPDMLLVYGDVRPVLESGVDVRFKAYENENVRRVRAWEAEERRAAAARSGERRPSR